MISWKEFNDFDYSNPKPMIFGYVAITPEDCHSIEVLPNGNREIELNMNTSKGKECLKYIVKPDGRVYRKSSNNTATALRFVEENEFQKIV